MRIPRLVLTIVLIGSFPMLIVLVKNKLLNFRDVIATKEYNLIAHFFVSSKNLIVKDLPSFLGLENVHNFVDKMLDSKYGGCKTYRATTTSTTTTKDFISVSISKPLCRW